MLLLRLLLLLLPLLLGPRTWPLSIPLGPETQLDWRLPGAAAGPTARHKDPLASDLLDGRNRVQGLYRGLNVRNRVRLRCPLTMTVL